MMKYFQSTNCSIMFMLSIMFFVGWINAGQISHPGNPLTFWKKAVALANQGKKQLSIVLIGDSNTEMNGYAPALRQLLQGCYGDAGIGYQPFGKRMQDIPGASTIIKTGPWNEQDFAIDPVLPLPPKPWFSPDGLWITTDSANAVVEVKHPYNAVTRLFYKTGPSLGSFSLSATQATINCKSVLPGIACIDFTAQTFKISEIHGTVALFGFDTRRPNIKGGAIVHQLGNGYGMAHHFAAIQDTTWKLLAQNMAPDLIVVMLGTNDMNNGWYAEEYQQKLDTLVQHLQISMPDASLLIVSCASCTFDRMQFGAAFSAAAHNVARVHNAGFWDLYKEAGNNWHYWDGLGLMEYTLHYVPANGLQVALRLLKTVGFDVMRKENNPAWNNPSCLLPPEFKPLEPQPKEGWPARPDRK